MRTVRWLLGAMLLLALISCGRKSDLVLSPLSCAARLDSGIRHIATTRDLRFEGKVTEDTAQCRGGETAAKRRALPWVDWENYFGTADATSLSRYPTRNWRGVAGALVDLEYQRAELIKFNLFDNSGTFEQYLNGTDGSAGSVLRQWPQMRLPSPLKRILPRTIPELAPVANAFDPWARDRGRYYSLDWKPRRGAELDAAFATP